MTGVHNLENKNSAKNTDIGGKSNSKYDCLNHKVNVKLGLLRCNLNSVGHNYNIFSHSRKILKFSYCEINTIYNPVTICTMNKAYKSHKESDP